VKVSTAEAKRLCSSRQLVLDLVDFSLAALDQHRGVHCAVVDVSEEGAPFLKISITLDLEEAADQWRP
jgi:hypothetical protein